MVIGFFKMSLNFFVKFPSASQKIMSKAVDKTIPALEVGTTKA